MSTLLLVLICLAAICCAVIAGVFLTFSDFVMRSLNATTQPGGIEAMQVINREVFRTVFMVQLIGMVVVSLLLIYLAWSSTSTNDVTHIYAGSATYLIAVFAVTMLGNVPLNERLDDMNHTDADTLTYWRTIYYPRWVRWNHIRTIGSGVASLFFLLAAVNY